MIEDLEEFMLKEIEEIKNDIAYHEKKLKHLKMRLKVFEVE